jgi:hypothetical protein
MPRVRSREEGHLFTNHKFVSKIYDNPKRNHIVITDPAEVEKWANLLKEVVDGSRRRAAALRSGASSSTGETPEHYDAQAIHDDEYTRKPGREKLILEEGKEWLTDEVGEAAIVGETANPHINLFALREIVEKVSKNPCALEVSSMVGTVLFPLLAEAERLTTERNKERLWNNTIRECEKSSRSERDEALALLREWRDTPFFETKDEWSAWVAGFRPRVEALLARFPDPRECGDASR